MKYQGFSRYAATRRGTHRNGFSGIQVLVLTPGVRVQVPPRAPKTPKSVDFGVFLFPKVTGIEKSAFEEIYKSAQIDIRFWKGEKSMKRTKIKNAAELKRLTVTEAKNTFLQHCKVKNLSESTLGYHGERSKTIRRSGFSVRRLPFLSRRPTIRRQIRRAALPHDH